MIARALLAALALAAAPVTAGAQTGGIQVAPVLVAMTPERAISSVRMRNGRDRPVSFEVEAYVWTQVNGEDVLTPTNELIVAPAVFEIPAEGEQTVRLGVRAASQAGERAYRVLLRELPDQSPRGVALGFSLEMSLPVFVTPRGMQANIETRVDGDTLHLTNSGASYAQISLLNGNERVSSPRYLLAGSSASVSPPENASAIRLIAGTSGGHQSERTVHVGRSVHHASVR